MHFPAMILVSSYSLILHAHFCPTELWRALKLAYYLKVFIYAEKPTQYHYRQQNHGVAVFYFIFNTSLQLRCVEEIRCLLDTSKNAGIGQIIIKYVPKEKKAFLTLAEETQSYG